VERWGQRVGETDEIVAGIAVAGVVLVKLRGLGA
jgi:hypothetical protein